MRVQDVMTEGVKIISPTTAAEDAWNMMRLNRIHHLVVTKGKQVVGVTVEPTLTVRQAANLMRGRSIGCLVVVESARVIGLVTVSDLLGLVGHGLDRGVVTTTRWTLKHRAPHHKSHRSAAAW